MAYEAGEEKPEKKKREPSAADTKKIAAAMERFQYCVDAEQEVRSDGLDDLKFRSGEQWPDAIRIQRENDPFGKRPCLVINKVLPAIRQVTNDQRQNRGAIKVTPVESGDIKTAEVLQGLIRHIEYDSDADVAFDTAFDYATTIGWGYVRVMQEYESPTSFNMTLKIGRVRNPFQVYLDPQSQRADGADADYAFIFEDMTREDYEREYPDSELASVSDLATIGDQPPSWISDTGVRVCEYYYREREEDTLYLLRDVITGRERSYLKSQLKEAKIDLEKLPIGVRLIEERETEVVKVKWCRFNAHEILDESEWMDEEIPIVPVYGDEYEIDGKIKREGMVRHAKDPQRMLNYWKSAETEAIALAPRAPWVGAEGQFENHPEWDRANVVSYPKLEYKPIAIGGTLIGAPQRNVAEPAVMAITNASLGASDDLKAVTQVYDAQLGQRSNETSGRGILARQQQGQLGNFHYIDNLTRARRRVARILIRMIPKVFTGPRVLRIVGEDGTATQVKVNQPGRYKGEDVRIDLQAGKYDVIASTGPGFATKRREALENMMQIISAAPALMGVVGDLVIRQMDWDGAQEMADRMAKTLPPNLQEQEGKQKLPPMVQQQMQQMDQMIQALTQQLNEAKDALQTKQLELESRERIEASKQEHQLALEQAKAQGKTEHEVTLEQTKAEIANEHELAMEQLRLETEQKFEMLMTQMKIDSQEAIAMLNAEVEAMKAKMQLDAAKAASEAHEGAEEM